MKLFIAVPSNRGWNAFFGNSIVNLSKYLSLKGVDFLFDCIIGSSCISRARKQAVKMAKDSKSSHILFIDDDIAFDDPKIISGMMDRNKRVVVTNYSTKQPWNTQPTCFGFENNRIESKGKTGIERIYLAGLGCALIDMEVFEKIDEPMFSVAWSGSDYVGEDFFFFMKLYKAGIECFVDHDASNKIAHVGDYAFPVR